MKITIVTIGSRGDLQPFLALGVGLSQAGHQVKLATHDTFTSGTTAEGLRAGVPTIIVPFLGDQTFWGNRLVSLGVGTKPIPQQDLTEDKLANVIATVVRDRAFAKRARDLSQQIKAEDGVGNAVKAIKQRT